MDHSTETPLIIMDPFEQELILKGKPKYEFIILILQDRHVSHQRSRYEELKLTIKESIHYPTWIASENKNWFFYLVLKQRFDPSDLTAMEEVYIQALDDWLRKKAPICGICGTFSILESCRGEDPLTDPYLYFATEDL